METNKTPITKEILLANGWINCIPGESGIRLFEMEKELENRNPLNNNPDDTDIKLILHHLLNVPKFAVLFPSGAMLNIDVGYIEDLNAFEQMVDWYDCEY